MNVDPTRTEAARHLLLIARELRSHGDIQQVRLSLDGVTRDLTLASELELIAMNLDFYASSETAGDGAGEATPE